MYVVLDAPPVRGMATASGWLAGAVDGIRIVVAAGRTRKDHAAQLRRLMAPFREKVLGCVLNKATVVSRGYYYSGAASCAEAVK